MKKYFIIVFFFLSTIPQLFSQTYPLIYPCSSADIVDCIANPDFDVPGYSDIMNYNGPNSVVSNWWVSHGFPKFINGGAPNNPYKIINMSSHQPPGQPVQSQGIFTCYSFEAGETYQVCFWAMNQTSASLGELRVYAAIALPQPAFPPPTTIPTVPNQLIDNSFTYSGAPNWQFVSVTFTPTHDFNQLWFYPYMAHDKIFNQEYSVNIDGVRVNKVSKTAGYNPTLTGTTNFLDGCGTSDLTVNNVPANGKVHWVPTPGLNVTSTTTATVTPCVTTEYIAVVTGDSVCPDCFRDSIRYTVTVNHNVNSADLINNSPNIPCGGTVDLDFIGSFPCPVTYSWYDPTGTFAGSGTSLSFPNASFVHTGLWELHIIFPNGCIEKITTQVNVQNCCAASADFNFNASNPVSFTDNTTGSGTIRSWKWDFGDGTTSDLPNPVHTYAAPGNYFVCLSIVMSDGNETCCDRICKQVTVGPPNNNCVANADFTFKRPINSPFTDFTSTSSGTGLICSYFWDFGDTNTYTGTNPNPRHYYNIQQAGTYTYNVCLTVWNCDYDINGNEIGRCSHTTCKQITFVSNPTQEKTGPISSITNNGKNKYKVDVYPNPATKEMFVEITGIDKPKVSIVTIQGVKVGEAKKVSDLKYKFDVSGLAAGIYFVNVEGDNNKQVIKFFKE